MSDTGAPHPVERLFPFVLRSRALLVGRDTLRRSKSRLHFLLLTHDLSENSRRDILKDFAAYPIVQHFTSADLERFFNLKGTKVVGFAKSGLAQSIYAGLKQHRINPPSSAATAAPREPADQSVAPAVGEREAGAPPKYEPRNRRLKLALVGAGMFGGDVHLRAYTDLQRFGIAGQLARLGLEQYASDFADVKFDLVAVGTRTEASAHRAAEAFARATQQTPRSYSGDTPWRDILREHPDLDVLAVATPDHLHTQPILEALAAGAHVLTEKPMCLNIAEADQIIELAVKQNRVVAVDMHKRYDPDHLRIRHDIQGRIGAPLYGTAYLEEPLEVSTSTFKWVESSDPFSYVGPHWVDLIWHYYHSKPVSLTAIGQKQRLVRDGINAYDAVQVRVDFANGMSINFHNNWITPADFEGPVNQGHEIVGADGKVESDQQYRGFRWWNAGGGSRTSNNHFTRDVQRPDGSQAYVGYGVDSIVAGLVAVCRMKFLEESRDAVADNYPTAEDARVVVAIVHAARIVRDLNFKYLREGKGAPVTARFGEEGITLVDPICGEGAFQKIYGKAL